MKIKRLEVGPLETNCYIVWDEAAPTSAMILDPGDEADLIVEACGECGVTPALIVNTHAHPDHVAADAALKAAFPGSRLCIGRREEAMLGKQLREMSFLLGRRIESPKPDELLEDGAELHVGGCALRVLWTPGHTPGHICLLAEAERPWVVFCGDLIFEDGVGRTDFPGGSAAQLRRSIEERIFTLPDETVLLPGHGGSTTVGAEKGTTGR